MPLHILFPVPAMTCSFGVSLQAFMHSQETHQALLSLTKRSLTFACALIYFMYAARLWC